MMATDKQRYPTVPFADVVRLNTERVNDPAAAGIERYVGIEHIEPEDLRIRRWGLVAEGTTFTNRFRPGQVLFAKRRAYQRKVALADFEGVCSGDIYVLETRDPAVLLPELLPFICQTDSFFHHAVDTSAGSLSPRTNWSRLAAYEFPLPPPDEQRRLVGVLLVQESLSGAIEATYCSLKSLKQSKLRSIFGDYSPHSEEWDELRNCCVKIGDGTHLPPVFTNEGIPFLLVSNIASGELDGEISKWITVATYEELTKAFQPSYGDILYSLVGSYGVPVFVDWNWPFSFQRHIGVIRTKENILRGKYLFYFLQSLPARRQADQMAEGLAQKTITLASLRSYKIPVPPVEIQDSLINELQTIDLALLSLRNRLEACIQLKAKMLSTI